MKIWNENLGAATRRNAVRAFTLPEVLCAALLIGIAIASIYLSLGQGYTFTTENSCNLRATQLVTEQMETMRLYTWSELTNTGFVPTAFTNYYYPSSSSNVSSGTTFTGTISITAPSMTEAYSNDIRLVTVTVNWYPGANWTSGSMLHTLSASTYVAHYGM